MLTNEERLQHARESKKRWTKHNRAKINESRRRRRHKQRNEKLANTYCLLCEISMVDHAFGTSIYCRDCVNRFKSKTKNHTNRRLRKALKKRPKQMTNG